MQQEIYQQAQCNRKQRLIHQWILQQQEKAQQLIEKQDAIWLQWIQEQNGERLQNEFYGEFN